MNWAGELVQKYTREQLVAWLKRLSPTELVAVEHDWALWGRPKQQPPPGAWSTWMLLAGRGFGKSLSGAQWVRRMVEVGVTGRVALIGATSADVRDTMIEGPSGLLNVFPAHQRPRYETSKRRVTFHNGAVALAYSADEPERLRGPNLGAAWCDELCAWNQDQEAWDQLMLCLRAGKAPQVCVTTTPKPTPLIVRLLNGAVYWDGEKVTDGKGGPAEVPAEGVVVTSGSTFENTTNLAKSFINKMKRDLEGTRLGRQELYAEVLLDVAGALFRPQDIEAARVVERPEGVERIVVVADPAPTSAEGSDLTGICVAGRVGDNVLVMEDLSCRETPETWARTVVQAYYRHRADCVTVERNRGGDMVKALLQQIDPNVPVKEVVAMRGKHRRAEPVAALYEQNRVKHLPGLEKLEKQMGVFTGEPGRRDDRVDALCWAVHELVLSGGDVWLV